MKTKWHPKARASYRQVAHYINSKFGSKARKDFIQRVKTTENQLKRNPNIGQIDPLFENRAITYRSIIINGLNKMVYFVKDETIYIAAFWDTRREPDNQASQVK